MTPILPHGAIAALACCSIVVAVVGLPQPACGQERISATSRDAVVRSIRGGATPPEVETLWREMAFRRGITDRDRRESAGEILRIAIVPPFASALQAVEMALSDVDDAMDQIPDDWNACQTLEEQLDELERSEPEAPVSPTDPAQVAAYYDEMEAWFEAVVRLNEELQACLLHLEQMNSRYGSPRGRPGAGAAAAVAVEESALRTETAARAFGGALSRATALVRIFDPVRRPRA